MPTTYKEKIAALNGALALSSSVIINLRTERQTMLTCLTSIYRGCMLTDGQLRIMVSMADDSNDVDGLFLTTETATCSNWPLMTDHILCFMRYWAKSHSSLKRDIAEIEFETRTTDLLLEENTAAQEEYVPSPLIRSLELLNKALNDSKTTMTEDLMSSAARIIRETQDIIDEPAESASDVMSPVRPPTPVSSDTANEESKSETKTSNKPRPLKTAPSTKRGEHKVGPSKKK